jgi:hypothetical protein
MMGQKLIIYSNLNLFIRRTLNIHNTGNILGSPESGPKIGCQCYMGGCKSDNARRTKEW